MSIQIGSNIFAKQGESIYFNIPIYTNGVLATNITSAKLAYFGGDMTEPEVIDCTVVAGGTIQQVIASADTLVLPDTIYVYEVKMVKTTSEVEEPVESGFIILRPTIIK